MGGAVAWEMARQLRARGRRIGLLALLDPTDPDDAARLPGDDRALAMALALDLAGLTGGDLGAFSAADLPAEGFLEALAGAARRSGALPPEIDADAVRRLFAVFKANTAAVARYRPQAQEGSVTILAPEGRAAAVASWARLAQGDVRAIEVPGDHFSMLQPPNSEALAERLGRLLRENQKFGIKERS
jgi:thioesterase domain-containing protein